MLEEKNSEFSVRTGSFATCAIPIAPPQLHGSLGNQQPAITVQTSSLEATGEGRMGLKFLQVPFILTVII